MDFVNMSSNEILNIGYVFGNSISIIMILLLFIENKNRKRTSAKCLSTMFLFLIIYFLGDILWSFAYFGIIPNADIFIRIAKIIYYSASNIIALAWLTFVTITLDPNFDYHKKRLLLGIPVLISILAAIIICTFLNPVRKDIYGYLTVLGLVILPFTYIITSEVLIIKEYKKIKDDLNKKRVRILTIWPIAILLVSILQVIFAEIPIYCFGALIVCVYFYIQNQNSYIFIDELTGINNRAMLNKYLNDIKESEHTYYILMVDIDKFKLINDNNGHLEGDKALIYFSNRLKKVLDKYKCFLARYGGDEFTIIYRTENEDEISNLTNEIKENLKASINDLGYEITASMGYSRLNDFTNSSDAIKKADEMLYQEKVKAHKNR